MKNFLIFTILIFAGSALPAQTLFSFGRHKVEKEEFLRAFNRNNTAVRNEQALSDYLQLYIAYKLKVQAAKDRKMDTLPQQKSDLHNFRRQLEGDYSVDSVVMQKLEMEAFQRSQVDIRLSHIFIPFDSNYVNSPAVAVTPDTLPAFRLIYKAFAELQRGDSFSNVAAKYSYDPRVQMNKGDIGYITVFSLPYLMESLVYSLPDGAFSAPLRSSAGYHIFKRVASRPALGRMRAAQILLAYSPNPSNDEKQYQKKLADSLFRVIQRGGDFSELAKQFSSERNAYSTGGLMPDITIGKYDPVFEQAVFTLKKDGEISKPFETAYGVHIVKRIGHFPVSDDSTQAEMLFKTEVARDARTAVAREELAQQLIHRMRYKKELENDGLLWAVTDSFITNNQFVPQQNISSETAVFSFDNETLLVKDWLHYIQSVKNRYSVPLPYSAIMKEFVAASAFTNYLRHLEDYNADFRNRLMEFSEGNLLFEIMEREVWNKAVKDIKGLKAYYEQHKLKYTWGPGVNAILFTTSDAETAESVVADINRYTGKWKTLGESTQGKIIADSARFEMEQIPGGRENLKPGMITKPVTDGINGSTSFMYILQLLPQRAQRSFEEAKGLVINDYQTVLEAQWVNSLKKKYPVNVNQKLLQSLVQ